MQSLSSPGSPWHALAIAVLRAAKTLFFSVYNFYWTIWRIIQRLVPFFLPVCGSSANI